jgi:catechol 2,3-dioxygenase-like lactoylglutathione lyase family enzyme
MSRFDHVLAVVPVREIEAAREWYTVLFGAEPTNNPMPTLIEWQVTDGGWVQVTEDADRAGSAMLNLAVSELAAEVEGLRDRGIGVGDIVDANKGVQLSTVHDPDGNTISLIGSFRVTY